MASGPAPRAVRTTSGQGREPRWSSRSSTARSEALLQDGQVGRVQWPVILRVVVSLQDRLEVPYYDEPVAMPMRVDLFDADGRVLTTHEWGFVDE